MFAYMLFLKRDDEDICKNIYAEDEDQLFNYTLDEDYIVKSEENKYKNIKELEEAYHDKSKSQKGKKKEGKSKLIKKEYSDIKQALFFLGGTLEDFKQGIHAHKKLPQVINPYDMDFEGKEEDFTPGDDVGDEFNEEKLLDDLKKFQDDDDDDKLFDDTNDDDFY